MSSFVLRCRSCGGRILGEPFSVDTRPVPEGVERPVYCCDKCDMLKLDDARFKEYGSRQLTDAHLYKLANPATCHGRALMYLYKGRRATMREIEEETGLAPDRIRAWMKKVSGGVDVAISALEASRVFMDGEHLTKAEAARRLGVNENVLYKLLKKGHSLEYAAKRARGGLQSGRPPKYVYKGRGMSIRAISAETSISKKSIENRLFKGMTVEQAVEDFTRGKSLCDGKWKTRATTGRPGPSCAA